MQAAVFDPEHATGTFNFVNGVRLTPVIKALLGALAFDAAGASESGASLAFSGEQTATWGDVLAHLTAQCRALGIKVPAAAPDELLVESIYALADHIGAHDFDIVPVIAMGDFTLTESAPADVLVTLAKLLDDGHDLTGYRIEEYSVNVTDGQCAHWNPFDTNFPSQAAAQVAAEQYIEENQDCTEAIVGRVVIVDNQICSEDSDDELARIEREDYAPGQSPAAGG